MSLNLTMNQQPYSSNQSTLVFPPSISRFTTKPSRYRTFLQQNATFSEYPDIPKMSKKNGIASFIQKLELVEKNKGSNITFDNYSKNFGFLDGMVKSSNTYTSKNDSSQIFSDKVLHDLYSNHVLRNAFNVFNY